METLVLTGFLGEFHGTRDPKSLRGCSATGHPLPTPSSDGVLLSSPAESQHALLAAGAGLMLGPGEQGVSDSPLPHLPTFPGHLGKDQRWAEPKA